MTKPNAQFRQSYRNEMMSALQAQAASALKSRFEVIRAKGAMLSTLHALTQRGFQLKCRACGGPAKLVGGRRICQVDKLHADPDGAVASAVEDLENAQRLHTMQYQANAPDMHRVHEEMAALMARHGRGI